MADRKLCLLSPTIGNLLVKQLAHEMQNFNLYMSFANFYAIEGLPDLELYWKKRADEELVHYKWCFDFLTEADFGFNYPKIPENTETFSDIITPFKLTVIREIETTNLIYEIYKTAMSEGDYMTAVWLQNPLIKEQIEEENTSRMALSIIEEETHNIFTRSKKILELLD